VAEEHCWADNTGGRAVLLRPIKFQFVGVRISTGPSCICIYIRIHIVDLWILISDLRYIQCALDPMNVTTA